MENPNSELTIDLLLKQLERKYKHSPADLLINFYEIIDRSVGTFIDLFKNYPNLLTIIPVFKDVLDNPKNYPDSFRCIPLLEFFIKELTQIKTEKEKHERTTKI